MTHAIALTGAGKRYVKYDDEPLLLTRALRLTARTRRSTLWAVRGVDLTVANGESIGIIGRNGSGKSTLLQMVAGVTAPSEGAVEVNGRVAPLVSVGVGFHPELTGRENVYVNGTILGVDRQEIDRRFDAIVEFSGIAPFIDTPVKFYSSGMFVRLGFSVAVEANPDVLLVDEVLAVGDLAFQVRCFERMRQIREQGTTIVVVSHNLTAVRHLCDRVVVLDGGRVRHDGDVEAGIALYHQILGEWEDPESAQEGHRRFLRGVAEIEQMRLLVDGEPSGYVRAGQPVEVVATVRFDADVEVPVFGISVTSASGVNVYSEASSGGQFSPARAGERRVFRARAGLPLASGSYQVHAGIHRQEGTAADTTTLHERRLPFYVAAPRPYGGVVDLAATFDAAPAVETPLSD